MKKIISLVLIIATSFYGFSQKEQENIAKDSVKSNEIKVNAFFLVLGAFEVSYEHLLNEESGIGISLFLPLDEDISDEVEYYVSPYYRFYFGKKHAAGFFLEGFGMLNRTNRDIDFIFDNRRDNWTTDFALGIGLGGKWISSKGFVGEINFGIGRNLFESEDTNYDFIGKFGITIGYRF